MGFLELEKQILWHSVLRNIRNGELGKIKRVRSQSIIDKDAKKSALSLHCIIREKD